HMADAIHVQMGMYGLLVVKSAGGANTAYTGGPPFNKSYNWIFSEIDTFWHRHIPLHDDVADTSRLPGPYNPSYFLINGHSETQLETDDSTKITGRENEYIYLRIGGIGFFRNRIIFPSWLNAKIIDSDGRPLPEEIESDTLDISPGERYGVMLFPTDQLEDFIPVQYVNMNTYEVWDTQYIPVNISGIVGINETNNLGILLFPNPADDVITITGLDNAVEIIIQNQVGQIIKIFSNVSENLQISLKDFPAGYYEVVVTQGEKIRSFPFVKQ
ncbi:MAG: T9SS type A sorting domain-containing protein, partial [Chitinophagales bacterium]